jgi:hypothetical protein
MHENYILYSTLTILQAEKTRKNTEKAEKVRNCLIQRREKIWRKDDQVHKSQIYYLFPSLSLCLSLSLSVSLSFSLFLSFSIYLLLDDEYQYRIIRSYKE